MPLFPEYPGPWIVDLILVAPSGAVGTFSMMSISPDCGQPTEEMLLPSIQNAGQSPVANGSFMRASILPYWKLAVGMPLVFRRAEVQVPLAVLIALITRFPFPSWKAFGLLPSHGGAGDLPIGLAQ